MAILDEGDYDAIRAVIDSTLTSNNLTNKLIEQPIFRDAAIQMVLDRDADAEGRTGDNAKRIKRAAIYFCAALLCPVVVKATSINIQARDLSYTRPAFDHEARAKELIALGETEIVAVLEPDATAARRPTLFAVAAGRRGR